MRTITINTLSDMFMHASKQVQFRSRCASKYDLRIGAFETWLGRKSMWFALKIETSPFSLITTHPHKCVQRRIASLLHGDGYAYAYAYAYWSKYLFTHCCCISETSSRAEQRCDIFFHSSFNNPSPTFPLLLNI